MVHLARLLQIVSAIRERAQLQGSCSGLKPGRRIDLPGAVMFGRGCTDPRGQGRIVHAGESLVPECVDWPSLRMEKRG